MERQSERGSQREPRCYIGRQRVRPAGIGDHLVQARHRRPARGHGPPRGGLRGRPPPVARVAIGYVEPRVGGGWADWSRQSTRRQHADEVLSVLSGRGSGGKGVVSSVGAPPICIRSKRTISRKGIETCERERQRVTVARESHFRYPHPLTSPTEPLREDPTDSLTPPPRLPVSLTRCLRPSRGECRTPRAVVRRHSSCPDARGDVPSAGPPGPPPPPARPPCR